MFYLVFATIAGMEVTISVELTIGTKVEVAITVFIFLNVTMEKNKKALTILKNAKMHTINGRMQNNNGNRHRNNENNRQNFKILKIAKVIAE